MTSAEWEACDKPEAMLHHLAHWSDPGSTRRTMHPLISDRKLRLFAVACCRAVWNPVVCPICKGACYSTDAGGDTACSRCRGAGKVGGLTDPRSRRAVAVAEDFAEGRATEEERHEACHPLLMDQGLDVGPELDAYTLPAWPLNRDATFRLNAAHYLKAATNIGLSPALQCQLLRCLVSPFAPALPTRVAVKVGDPMFLELEPRCRLRKWREGDPHASATVMEVLPENKIRVMPVNGGPPGVWEAPAVPAEWAADPTVRALALAAETERGPVCGECGGKGMLIHRPGPQQQFMQCPACHGQGRIVTSGLLDAARLGVLADALEDKGCPEEVICPRCVGECIITKGGEGYDRGSYYATSTLCGDCQARGRVPNPLLAHLRAPGPHVLGCWCLDALLGKE